MKTAIIMGRFQPITIAHKSLIQDSIEKYDETFVVVVNSAKSIIANSGRRLRAKGMKTVDDVLGWDRQANKENSKLPKSYKSKKGGLTPGGKEKLVAEKDSNPFSGMYRKILIHKSFSGKLHKSHIISNEDAALDMILKKVMSESDSNEFVFICGKDRESGYQIQVDRLDIPGITVSLDVIERDPDSDQGIQGVSATKARQAIKNNDRKEFEKIVPKEIHNEFEKMKSLIMTEEIKFFKRMLSEMTHIEDLKVDEFIDFVKNIYQSEASIKLDGTANLAFGISDEGKLYTAFGRTTFHKGGVTPESKRSYSIQDWLDKGKLHFNSAASAHAALLQVQDIITSVVKPGQEVSTELMFGDKPNCIKYDFHGMNYIVILNNDELADKLSDKQLRVTVNNLIIDTDNLKEKTVKQNWKFGKTETVDPSKYDINIKEELEELEKFLNDTTDGQRNIDILSMRAAGKSKDMILKVRDKAKRLKLNVKEKLLKQFVRQVKDGDYSPSEGYSHEGIVLKNKKGEMTKIIDKDVFTAIHDRDWQPSHDAGKIIKQFEKSGISKQEALDYLNDRIKNFETYYSNVSDDMKEKMKDSLKMMRIELRNQS